MACKGIWLLPHTQLPFNIELKMVLLLAMNSDANTVAKSPAISDAKSDAISAVKSDAKCGQIRIGFRS